MPDPDPIRMGEEAEIAAWESVWNAAPEPARTQIGLSCERSPFGGFVSRASGFGWWFFNRIVGVGFDTDAGRAWLDEQLNQLAAAGQPYGASICESMISDDLAAHLTSRGLKHTSTLAKMIRRSDGLQHPETTLDIREIGPDETPVFADTVQAGYGMPSFLNPMFLAMPGLEGWHCYVAFDNGEPVGTGAMHIVGDVAWLGFGSVLADRRRSGFHRSMMLHRMCDAADLGCRWLVTETNRPEGDEPAPSYHNMERNGFQLAYCRANWVKSD
jgi:Acetyltransferase (GNAT) family